MTSPSDMLRSTAEPLSWRVFDDDGTTAAEKTTNTAYVYVDFGNLEMGERTGCAVQVFAHAGFTALSGILDQLKSAISYVRGAGKHSQLSRVFMYQPGAKVSSLATLLEEIEGWAQTLDLQSALDKFKAERPDRPLAPQLSHLASLIYLGEVETLSEYRRAFEDGAGLNFVPAITISVLDAALRCARQRLAVAAQPTVQPDGPASRGSVG